MFQPLSLPTGWTVQSRNSSWALPLKDIPSNIFFILNKSPAMRNTELYESEHHAMDGASLSEILEGCAFQKLVTRKQVFLLIGDKPRWHLSSRRETGARSQPFKMHSQNF